MACPEEVLEALDGLPSITDVDIDLADDRVDIRFDSDGTEPDEFLRAVRALGFDGTIVERRRDPARLPRTKPTLDPDDLPPVLAAVFDAAAASGRLVLLDFGSPECVSCRRMRAVTYPDTAVTEETDRWHVAHLDVSDHERLTSALGVLAMPTAIAFSADGTELGRRRNFVEPAAFRAWLESLRTRD